MINTGLLAPSWQQQLATYDVIYVGLSGGLDSTVLLHQLAAIPKLFSKLYPIHIHHGLSEHADAWQAHCLLTCQALKLSLDTIKIQVGSQSNVEEAARIARYDVFSSYVKANQCLVTAHHQDDQAETLLLHLMRGAGVKGLSGIATSKPFSEGFLLRPFLRIERSRLLDYAQAHQLTWIEDESNANLRFSRNFLRHEVLPLLQKKWPGVMQNLARTARICHAAQANLDDLAKLDYPELATCPRSLAMMELTHLTAARVMNVLRYWLHQQGFRSPSEDILQRVLDEVMTARQDADPLVSWDDVCIKRYEGRLYVLPVECLKTFDSTLVMTWQNFPEEIRLPGVGVLSAQLFHSFGPTSNSCWAKPQPTLTGIAIEPGDQVEIRFRHGGERFRWHGQTKSLKKLMQTWLIPPWSRPRIPLLFVNGALAAVVGYAVSDTFYRADGYVLTLR